MVFSQNFETVTYYENDTTKLKMDLFLPDTSAFEELPVFIFVHGGGFSVGDRASGHKICTYLADRGFAAASITYELYMKGKNFSCGGILSEKIKAIQFAVNDLWLATGYLLENAEEYHLDKSKLFIGGSSAGAETALHALYWNYDLMNWYPKSLPDQFAYAGLVVGGGAIMDLNLINENNLVPTMLVHGSCDRLVPYNAAAHHYCPVNASGWLLLYGSYAIFNRLVELGGCTQLYTFCNGGHEYCGKMFHESQEEVYRFLIQVLNKDKIQNHSIIQTNKECLQVEAYNFCE